MNTIVHRQLRKLRLTLRGKRNARNRLRLLREMPKSAVCAEIGVWKGDFSELIRSMTSPRKFHLIDPWEFQSEFPERMYGGSVAKSQADMDRIFEDVRVRFSGWPNIVINKGKSEHVLREFEDAYFDWLYIDGNHYYEYVLRDLQLCLSKVKPGGIIAGDDYEWGEKDGYPVRRAVQDFIAEHELTGRLKLLGSQYIIRI
jgi:Methyltransferase domain